MAAIDPISTGAAAQTPRQEPTAPDESRLPSGRQLSSVQPHPTPLLSAAQAAQPVVDENARWRHTAQLRAEITGTGRIVDADA